MKKYTFTFILLFAAFGRLRAGDLLLAQRDNNYDTITGNWVGYDSTLHFYDDQSRISFDLNLFWNSSTSTWDTTHKLEYHYHPVYGVLAFTIGFQNNAGIWDSTSEDIYQYYTDTTLLHHTSYYNLGSGFIPYYREDYYYNTNKQVNNYYKKTWNSGTNTFDNSSETLTHYNSSNQNDSIRKLNWSGSAYVNNTLTIFLYNTQGLVSTETDFSWNGTIWTNGRRYSQTYNIAGKRTESVLLINMSSIWVNAVKYSYSYTGNIYLQEEDDYDWDNTNSIWYAVEKKEYHLNTDNQVTEVSDSALDRIADTMYLNGLFTYEYDADGNNSYYRIAEYVSHLNTIRNTNERFNWYLLSVTGVEEPTFSQQVNIFPNPATGMFTTSFTNGGTRLVNINLYDENGRLVNTLCNRYEAPGNIKISANISNLQSGIYYVQINANTHTTVKKLVVQ